MTKIIRLLLSLILVFGQTNVYVKADTAAILPPAYTQFFDSNGNPLSSGKVYFYIPSTTTFKSTWQDAAETILNANPVTLDAAGKAKIFGSGAYRQILRKANGDTVWDALTYSPGSSGGGGGSTGDGDLVATVKPWAGLVAPNQYVFAYGQEIVRLTYPELFTAITQQSTVNCTSGSATISGLTDTTQIPIGAAIEATCLAPTTTVIAKTSSTLTVSIVATITLNTSATIFPYGNGDGSTTFNVPDLRGRAIAGRDNMGGTAANTLQISTTITTVSGSATATISSANVTAGMYIISTNLPVGTTVSVISGTTLTLSGNATASGTLTTATVSLFKSASSIGAVAGAVGHAQTQAEMFAHRHGITDPGHTHTYTIAVVNSNGTNGGSTDVQSITAGVATGSSTTGISTSIVGNTAAMPILSPYITFNYIIKVTADTNSSVATGVLSLGGQTGVIACGSGLTCTGNIIDSSYSAATFSITSYANIPRIRATGGTPTLTSCGTSPVISGSDVAGVITMGTGAPAGCVVTFSTAYTSTPYCNMSWQTNLASMQYTITASAMTLVQTATSSNKVGYICVGQSGG